MESLTARGGAAKLFTVIKNRINSGCGALLLGLLICSCGKKEEFTSKDAEAGKPLVVQAVPLSLGAWSPGQRHAAELFGQTMSRLLNTHRSLELARNLDEVSVVERAFAGIDLHSSAFAENFHQRMTDRARELDSNPFKPFEAATTHFLGLRSHDGKDCIRMRVVFHTGACTFLECFVAFNANDEPTIADFYNDALGLTLEQNFRTLILSTVPNLDNATLDRLSGSSDPSVRGVLSKYLDAVRNKEHNAARALFPELPAILVHDKVFFMLHARNLSAAGETAHYEDFLEQGRTWFPEDPAMDFLLAEEYSKEKLYDRVDVCYQNIVRKVEDDGYIEFLRALNQKEAGHTEAALELAGKTVAVEPELEVAYELRLGLALKLHDFGQASSIIEVLEKRFHKTFRVTPELGPEYQEFGKSPEYQKWLESHPAP